jgi:hypothetical protein
MNQCGTDIVRTRTFACSERSVRINPLLSQGWDSLLRAQTGSSFFHKTAWARVLHETYGHFPVYFCQLAGGELKELLPIMEISSPLTGCRGVSLPFTDVCFPLQTTKEDLRSLYELAVDYGLRRKWRFLECRGNDPGWEDVPPSLAFYGHVIDLSQGQGALFKNFNGAVRRGILKAARSGLRTEFSNSFDSVRIFYSLHCMTRRRHGLPPQPFRFFENVARYVLAEDDGLVATAWWEDQPIASGVFFHHNRTVFYKFGASDYAFQHLRPNNTLLWETMKRYVDNGFETLHLGRTSLENEGLRRFKLGFGAREETIKYYQFDLLKQRFVKGTDHSAANFRSLLRYMPLPVLRLAGEILYPHLS